MRTATAASTRRRTGDGQPEPARRPGSAPTGGGLPSKAGSLRPLPSLLRGAPLSGARRPPHCFAARGVDAVARGPPACAPPESLLAFDAPLFVGDGDDEERRGEDEGDAGLGGGGRRRAAPLRVDDALDAMLPPREWTQASGTWMQYVDKSPADRDAVLRLQRKLDELLNDRQARVSAADSDAGAPVEAPFCADQPRQLAQVSGMCEVRAYLYRQACDELVRHVALDCPERGLLLLRARDERRMALDAWGCVFDESMGFGLRKAVESEPGAGEARDRAEALRSGNDALKRQIAELQKQAAVSAKRDAATAEADDKRRKNEIEGYKFQGISLDALLRKLSAAPPAMPQNLL